MGLSKLLLSFFCVDAFEGDESRILGLSTIFWHRSFSGSATIRFDGMSSLRMTLEVGLSKDCYIKERLPLKE